MNITKPLLKKLRKEIDEALKSVGERNDVTLTTGNASFNRNGTGHFKLEIATLSDDGEARDLDAEAFTSYAELVGMKKEDLHKKIMLQGRGFKIAGYNPKARKNSIMIEALDTGRSYVCTPQQAINAVKEADALA